jgi:hypothetical protein
MTVCIVLLHLNRIFPAPHVERLLNVFCKFLNCLNKSGSLDSADFARVWDLAVSLDSGAGFSPPSLWPSGALKRFGVGRVGRCPQ